MYGRFPELKRMRQVHPGLPASNDVDFCGDRRRGLRRYLAEHKQAADGSFAGIMLARCPSGPEDAIGLETGI